MYVDFSGDASVLAQGCRDCYEACVSGDGPIECFKSSFASLPRSLFDQLSRYGRWDWAGLKEKIAKLQAACTKWSAAWSALWPTINIKG